MTNPSRSPFSLPLSLLSRLVVVPLLAGLLSAGCGGKEEGLEPGDLGPNEVAVFSTDPFSGKIDLASPVALLFSGPVMPPEVRPGSYVEEPGAGIDPDVPGVWRWAAPDKLEFVPDDGFLPNRTYTITLDPGIGKARGVKLRGKRRFLFVAEPFAVGDVRLFREALPGAPPRYEIKGTVSFNYPVDPGAFEDRLSLDLSGRGALRFEVETAEPSELISFRSESIERGERDLTLVAELDGDLAPVVGGATLGKTVRREMSIPARERLVIESAEFVVVEGRKAIRLSFSAPVDDRTLARSLQVEPDVGAVTIDLRGSDAFLFADWQIGTAYDLRLPGDLISETGLALERDFRVSVLVGDLTPTLEIAGEGSVLALRGDRRVAVRTVNVDRINVEIDRVYENNLVHFFHRSGFAGSARFWGDVNEYGANLYRSDLDVSEERPNETVVTPIALDEHLRSDEKGIFRLSVRDADSRRLRASRFVLVTDIGLVAKRSEGGIRVGAVSIDRLEPIPSVDIAVRSRNDQVLASGRTGPDGFASFSDLGAGRPGDEPFLVTAARGDDRSFLLLGDTRIPTGDFDVGGVDPLVRGYEAFVYSDRGIYRPGDRARIAWIVRDGRRLPPSPFPLTLRVHGPDGKVFREIRVTTGADGFAEAELEIPDWAATGAYPAALHLDENTVIGRLDLQVEDFMPDRMKVDLDLLVNGESSGRAGPGDGIVTVARAMTLFGPPAAERRAVARLRFSPESVSFAEWPGFRFGDPPEDSSIPEQGLGEKKTDVEGMVHWEIVPPPFPDYHGWLRATVTVEATELGGGRAVGGTRTFTYSPVSHLVGLRRVGDSDNSDYVEPGKPIPFEAVLVDEAGIPVTDPEGRLRVYRQRWRTTIERDRRGRYRYVSEMDEELEQDKAVSLTAGAGRFEVTVPRHGSYRLVVESPGRGARGSIPFYVYGWGYSPWAMSNPEKVNLKLDRDVYRPGDMVRAEIEAPFAGLLLLSIERESVLHQEWIRLDSNSAVVSLRLPEEAEPNAYLTALLLRPLGSLEIHAPARAFGAVPIVMDREPSRLAVEIRAPESMRPENDLVLSFRLPDLPGGRRGQVTVAAVDEGILQITDFETPSPLDHFFRRRRLAVASHDLWSLLLPEYETVLRSSSASGGAARRKNLSPISVRRVKPVALWSGVIEGSGDWREVRLPVPEFSGALRVMVVAAAGDRLGSADALIRVRDPIVLTSNLPRFLAPGDEVEIPVQVYNGVTEKTGAEIPIRVRLDLEGPVDAPEREEGIRLAGGREGVVSFLAVAGEGIGKATFRFTGEAEGERTTTATDLAVRPPWPLETDVTRGVVRRGEPAEIVLPDRWHAGTGSATVTVSGLPVGSFAAAIPYLLRYPYGCTEQTVSRAFPLLYLADLAAEIAPGAFTAGGADYYVNSAIDRVAAMWVPGRGFAYWPGRGSVPDNPWSTVYATHFLVEASRKGYVVPPGILDGALAVAAEVARSSDAPWFRSWERWERLSARAYAAYVLARAGRPDRGACSYLARNETEEMTNAARALLAGAYGLLGNRVMMEQLLPVGPEGAGWGRTTGRTWRSEARDEAIRLEVLATVDPGNAQVPVLIRRLAEDADEGR
ncbi:MAG: MG2 domain-containing protein [Candidatus Eisenbacteria bacterium]